MPRIEINDRQTHLKGQKRRLASVLRSVLASEGLAAGALSVTLVDDAEISRINRQYLNHDGPTDVISFDLSDAGDDRLSGEIVVSAERAVRVATQRGTDPVGELLLYAVHGLLHLAGYDDRTTAQAARMHARENELLTALGYPDVYQQGSPAAS
ncbi:MAG TPA: rRNA maturation RNase YbeY [Phycisphaerae bacterium]|nr:rRNA maturation RNase YbeY [Phycisphaerae bacterium]HOI54802.1 rRNA maturation RNase YbeY [Phycisphaerae bacterium]